MAGEDAVETADGAIEHENDDLLDYGTEDEDEVMDEVGLMLIWLSDHTC